MSRPLADRVMALAGVVQAAALVNEAATSGRTDPAATQAVLGSILMIEAADVPSVFGGVASLRHGLQRLVALLGTEHDPSDPVILRYTLGLMQLQGKLLRRSALRATLEDGVRRSREQMRHFGPMHANVLAGLAETYRLTAGTIQPRILVTGNPVHLQNPRTVNLVRSLLLGGLRAAVLWRQCGGTRWALLFMRTRLLRETERLLRDSGRYV